MTDEYDRGLQRGQLAFEPFDRRQVEVIGRFVEQQDLRPRGERAGERDTARLAAGQYVGIGVGIDAEPVEQRIGAAGIVHRPEARLDIADRGVEAGEVDVLRQIAHAVVGMQEALAAVTLGEAGGDLHQRRLARAVAADEADAVAFLHAQLRPVEQRRAAEREVDVFQAQQLDGHGHGSPRGRW